MAGQRSRVRLERLDVRVLPTVCFVVLVFVCLVVRCTDLDVAGSGMDFDFLFPFKLLRDFSVFLAANDDSDQPESRRVASVPQSHM